MNIFWLSILKVVSVVSFFRGEGLTEIRVKKLRVVISIKSPREIIDIVFVNEDSVGD